MRTGLRKVAYLSKKALRLEENQLMNSVDSEIKKEILENIVKNIYLRDMKFVITSRFEGVRLNVYNGKEYISFLVTKKHIGFKVGCFIQVKKKARHV